MYSVVVWWDLHESAQTIGSLREYVENEAAQRYAAAPGLHLKFWIADPQTDRWGAVFLWESAQAAADAAAALPARAAELIGGPPHQRAEFQVEAFVQGPARLPAHSLSARSGGVEP